MSEYIGGPPLEPEDLDVIKRSDEFFEPDIDDEGMDEYFAALANGSWMRARGL